MGSSVPDGLLAGVFAILGIWSIICGERTRKGKTRYWESKYRDHEWPVLIRNAAFAGVPLGIADWGMALVLSPIEGRLSNGLGFALFFIFLPIGMWVMFSPPRWLKPEWLNKEESETAAVEKGSPSARDDCAPGNPIEASTAAREGPGAATRNP
jgi:hypothetical protein